MGRFRSAVALTFLVAGVGSVCGVSAQQIPDQERAALLAIFNATGGNQWLVNDGWVPLITMGATDHNLIIATVPAMTT